RQKGVVVGLGGFGTKVDRETMVWNDVTLVMQLAYGPGRYDPVYEEGNVDYPIGYVRWSENRNAQHFLRLVAEGKVQPLAIEPERFAFADAPAAYERLKQPDRPPTLLFEYPNRHYPELVPASHEHHHVAHNLEAEAEVDRRAQ